MTASEQSDSTVPRFHLVRAGDLVPRPMDWLVSDLFERDALVLLFGDPGAAKTFMALDLACCIATGTNYHGMAVKQGPVVFVAGEGQNGLARRLKAWCIQHGKDLKDEPLYVSNVPAAMTDPESLAMVLGAIEEIDEPPVLVVLDTLARNFGPGDENSTQDMTSFIRGCDHLRMTFGCTVAVIHHSGHGDKSRGRGSTALNGAMDSAFQLSVHDQFVQVKCTKQKDAPVSESFAFEFQTVELGLLNDDGSEAVSAALHPVDAPQAPPKVIGKHQAEALKTLDFLTNRFRDNLASSGKDPDQARVSVEDWRQECISMGIPRPRWYDVKKALIEKMVIEIEGDRYVRKR